MIMKTLSSIIESNIYHSLQLILGFGDSLPVIGVHNVDETLRVLEIMPPEWPDLILTADIPDGEADVLVFHGLNVEANGGNGRDDLTQLELVENGCLASSIETD